MLLIFALLASVVASFAAQGESSPLPPDAKKALYYIAVWNESLERYALQWITTPNIVKTDATIKEKQCFKKTDKTSWFDKTLKAFGNQIKENKEDVSLTSNVILVSNIILDFFF
ncbi:unnamed protein product [Haemonchus placei]|uniref:Salivary lipocalin n=1 Tax=Haemonchus placei TaxID=6290 RepID=A0A0N4X9L2_HAEPC|nr:unnamed protein product [Haemonchus placei]